MTEKGTESRGLPCLQFSPKGTILPCLSFSLRSRATVHTWTSACDLFGLNFVLLCFHLETEYFSRYSYSIIGISLFQTQQKKSVATMRREVDRAVSTHGFSYLFVSQLELSNSPCAVNAQRATRCFQPVQNLPVEWHFR